MEQHNKQKFLINALFAGVVVISLYLIIRFLPFFLPFIIGYLIASVSRSSARILEQKLKMNIKIAAAVSVTFFIIFTAALIFIGVSIFIRELSDLSRILPQALEGLPGLINAVTGWFHNLISSMPDQIANYINSWGSGAAALPQTLVSVILNLLYSVVSALPDLLIGVVICVISAYFFCMDYNNIRDSVKTFLPKKYKDLIFDIKRIAQKSVCNILRSYLILMGITFAELAVGLFILRIPYALTAAAMIALVDILPVLGVGTVLLPWSLISFISGNIFLGVGLLAVYLIISFIRPAIEAKLVGVSTDTHPLLMLIAVFIGLRLFGLWGIFALPLCLIVAKNYYDLKKTT